MKKSVQPAKRQAKRKNSKAASYGVFSLGKEPNFATLLKPSQYKHPAVGDITIAPNKDGLYIFGGDGRIYKYNMSRQQWRKEPKRRLLLRQELQKLL